MASRRSNEYAIRRRKARKRKQQGSFQLEALEPKILLAGDTSAGVAQVISVVPQPIARTAGGNLSQASNQIVVHFNDVDLLDSASAAENPNLYQLIYTSDTITNTDDTIHLPTSVDYDAATDRAVLTFSTDISALHSADAPFRLRINTAPTLPSAPSAITHATDLAGSSFSTAVSATGTSTGSLTGTVVIDAAIEPQVFALEFPGADSEPGMRNNPGQPHFTVLEPADAVPGITTIPYNFQTFYGIAPNGATLRNQITETQKDRAREVFDLYGTMFGVQFYETDSEGYTVATGDLRALQTTFQTSGVGGIVAASGSTDPLEFRPTAIMDLAEPWDDSFGGSWYQAAMREISHLMGIGVTPEVSGANIVGNLSESESAVTILGVTDPTQRIVTTTRFTDFNPFGADIQNDDVQFGLVAERIFPGDATEVLGRHLHRPDSVDIDLYRFRLNNSGRFSAETVAERLGDSSLLDTHLTLFNARGEVIASNDDYFSEDSLIDLTLEDGTYYIGVTASGNTDYDPVIENTGLNGTSDGPYSLRLEFQPETAQSLLDASGRALDGDGDGTPGGVFNFWFEANSADRTIYVDKSSAGGDGSLQSPFNNIALAVASAEQGNGDIIRIVGNGGADGNINTLGDNLAYELGFDNFGELSDGGELKVPRDTTVMIDAGAVFKMRRSYIHVGSSTTNVDRSGGALQILGTPDAEVIFTSRRDEATGVDTQLLSTVPEAGDWGGLVIRNDIDRQNFKNDFEARGIFLNYIDNADIRYGGGNVTIDSVQQLVNPIHLVDARPTISFNDIMFSADAAISANPDSFEESRFRALDSLGVNYQSTPFTSDYDRVGPDILGNVLTNNTTNAISIRIDTLAGTPLEELTVSGRFDDTSIVHALKENLIIGSTPGGPRENAVGVRLARTDAQLVIDPGIVLKMDGSRIDTEVSAQLIAEANPDNPIIITSMNDDRYGGVTEVSLGGADPGDWGGIYVGAGARLSLDNVVVAYGGGVTRVPGSSTAFNALEIHQAEAARVTNSTFEFNASGVGGISQDPQRVGHGTHGTGAIFVRGAQPVLIGNTIRDTSGTNSAAINIDVNSLTSERLDDYGRSRGALDRFIRFDDNQGPLIRDNLVDNNTLNGMAVRGGVVTTELVWDDTDIVHVVADPIIVPNYFSNGGLRLESSTTESLVVKFDGVEAGFTTTGTPLDIDDRIGGILHVTGQPGHPVVLTSLADDSVGAGLGLDGRTQTDTDGGVFTRPLRTEERGSFQIDINLGPVIREHPHMVAGVEQAAREWEKLFEDPITVTIDVELDSAATNDAQGRGAGTFVIPDQDEVQDVYIVTENQIDVTFDRVVGGLQSDAREHESFVEALPGFDSINIDFPDTPENPFSLGEEISVNTANYKAIFTDDVPLEARTASAFDADEAVDGSILLNEGALGYLNIGLGPDFFDIDRTDGLQTNTMDFVGVVGSAISTILGFTSSIEDVRTLLEPQNQANPREINLRPFDLFRLEPGEGGEDFATADRTLNTDQQSHVFYDGGVFDPVGLPRELRLQDGDIPLLVDRIETDSLSSNAFVTGYELPDNLNGAYLGIAQPALPFDFELNITDQDRSVFDLIGYDVVGGPLSGDWRGITLETYTHDSNVALVTESEDANDGEGSNNRSSTAQFIGGLAPESKDADENRRIGLEVHGFINNPADVDVYSFNAVPGTELWLDIDRTSQALDSIIELVDANGTTLARSDNSLAETLGEEDRFEAPGSFTFSMNKSPFLSKDHFSTNPYDAGMRVILRGSGEESTPYFVRVTSDGRTEGHYELQIRTRELDEVPGTSIQFADIRYAVDGIRVSGLPRHSPLTGEAVEDGSPNDTLLFDPFVPDAFQIYDSNVLRPFGIAQAGNDPGQTSVEDIIGVEGGEFANPQYVGNILTSDQGAISIAGNLTPFASTIDVDYYMFSVDYEAVQTTGSFTAPLSANLMFDLDYADGIGRADTSIYIYEAIFPIELLGGTTEFDVQLGNLVAIGDDSGDLDDLPVPGQFSGAGLDDLSRGSVGANDPMLGPISLFEGNYILAIAPSTLVVKEATSQFLDDLAANPFIRHEPIGTVSRVADQDFDFPAIPEPELPVLIEESGFVPFHLSDVTLFVSAPGGDGTEVWTVDPYQGGRETFVGPMIIDPNADDDNGGGGGGGGDGALATVYDVNDFVLAERQAPRDPRNDNGRVDEQLFAFTTGDTDANSGNYLVVDPGTGYVSGAGQPIDDQNGGGGNQGGQGGDVDPEDFSFSDDGIDTYIVIPPEEEDGDPEIEEANEGVQFEALALQQFGVRNYVGYAVGHRNDPALDNILYLYDHQTGTAISDPLEDREEDEDRVPPAGLEEFFGYSDVRERGVLHTEADYSSPGGSISPNENTALVVPAATGVNGETTITDAQTFTVTQIDEEDEANNIVTVYEFDTVPEGLIASDPAAGTFVRDGDEFFVGDVTYEVETGPVLVLQDDLSNYTVGDSIVISDIRSDAPAMLIEISRDNVTVNPNAVPLNIGVGDTTELAANLVDVINNHSNSAVARRVGNRISLQYEAGVISGSSAIQVVGSTGTAGGDNNVLVPMEEFFTSSQIVDAMVDTIPGAFAEGNRIGFMEADSVEFFDLDVATPLNARPGVGNGNVRVPFLSTYTAEQVAESISMTIGNGSSAAGIVVTLPQGGGLQFTEANDSLEIGGQSPGGRITGMTFVGSRLLGVSDRGGLYEINNYAAPEAAVADYIESSAALSGTQFSGLTLGPQDVGGGAYSDILFATDRGGNLHAFTVDGTPAPIFVNGATSVPTGVLGPNGLAFSSLQENLWAPTFDRATDPGHGDFPGGGGASLKFGGDRDIFYPGGAQGTIISNEIDLSSYSAADLPALYFTYFFVAEESEEDPLAPNINRDAFRVFVADDAASQGRGEWQMVATSDAAVPLGVEPLFTNSFADTPRLTRNPQYFDDIDEVTDFDPDLSLGGTGDRDTFPFQGEFEDDPAPIIGPTPRIPFPDGNGIEGDDWLDYTMLDERQGVWRQAKIDLAPFAGSESLRLRFDFSTAASFDLGGFGGVELKAVAGDQLESGQTFTVNDVTFEVELGLMVASPAGTSIAEGETVYVLDNEGVGHRFELDSDDLITEGNIPVFYEPQNTAVEVTDSFSAALAGAGLEHTVFNNIVTIDADNALVSGTSLFDVKGGGIEAGVADGNVPFEVNQSMSGAEVAAVLLPLLSDNFAGGDEQAFAATGNVMRLYGVEVNDPGPLGFAGDLPGDGTGAFTNGPGTPAYRGLDNQYRYYDVDEDEEEDPTLLNPNLIDPEDLANQNSVFDNQPLDFLTWFEGLYIDDIVIGFRARGEEIVDHRLPHPVNGVEGTEDAWNLPPYTNNERVPDLFAGSEAEFEIGFSSAVTTGEYQVEIRLASQEEILLNKNDRVVPGNTLLSPAGTGLFDGKLFQISDGIQVVTFEYNDLAVHESGVVSAGNIAVDFRTTDDTFDVATSIRDAINDSGLELTATSADGGVSTGVTTSRSNRVNLFGNAVIPNLNDPNGIDFLQATIEASGNRNRDQGQLIITQNQISNSARHGVVVEDALRDLPSYEWADPSGREQHAQFSEGDYTPQPGPARNLREINAQSLTTGVVISNNIIAFNEEGGIKYGGDPNGYIFTAPFGKNPPDDILEVWDRGGVDGGHRFTIIDHNNHSVSFEFHDLTLANPGVPGVDWGLDFVPIFYQRDDFFNKPPDDCIFTDCEARYTPFDLDMADRVQEALERSTLDVNVFRGKGHELFIEGAAFIGNTPNNAPWPWFVDSFVSRVQTGAVPFGRIVNNTIVGMGGRLTDTRVDEVTTIDVTAEDQTFLRVVDDFQDVGIEVGDNADPALLNNVIVNFETGVKSDFTAIDIVRQGLVFQANGRNTENTNVGDFASVLDINDPLFVDILNGNFYPAAGSTIIDSSIDSLEDRPALVTVKEPLGISRSPILAPDRDALGQLREDDPRVETENGQGRNAFKDRGAIDRVDFVGPRVDLVNPRDNDAAGIDQNPATNIVSLNPDAALDSFDIQFVDSSQLGDTQDGTGIDPFSITGESVTILRDGTPLLAGTDFIIDVDTTNSVLRLIPTAGSWPIGSSYDISLGASVQDIAGNTIQNNQPGGGVGFTVSILLGTDYGDAPEGFPEASHDIVSGFFLGTSVTPENATQASPDAAIDGGDNGVRLPSDFERNAANGITVTASADGVLDAWFDFNGDGDWNDDGERVFTGVAVVAGANELNVNVPTGGVSGQITARFRFSSTGSPGASGHVTDGEVEDYAVFVDLGNVWQNVGTPLDVNNDGSISAVDVLRIIREINDRVASDPFTAELSIPAVDPNTPQSVGFVDVNGDGFVTASDALLVIDALNNSVAGEPILVDPIGEVMQNPVVQLPQPAPPVAALDQASIDDDLIDDLAALQVNSNLDDAFADFEWISESDV